MAVHTNIDLYLFRVEDILPSGPINNSNDDWTCNDDGDNIDCRFFLFIKVFFIIFSVEATMNKKKDV